MFFLHLCHIVCEAESIQLSGVRLSVCLSHPAAARRCCRFAAVGPAGRRYRSIGAAAAGKCGQCHVVSVTQLAYRREPRRKQSACQLNGSVAS